LVAPNGKVAGTHTSNYPYVFTPSHTSKKLTSGNYKIIGTTYLRSGRRTRKGSTASLPVALTVGSGGSSTSSSGSSSSTGSTISSSGSSSSSVPVPNMRLWTDNMTRYGRMHCENLSNGNLNAEQKLAATYYDAEWVFYQIGAYTGDSYWNNCSQRAEAVYRDAYVTPNNGQVPGYWDFSHGMTEDYLQTQDQTSKSAVIMLSQNAAYAPDTTPLAWTENANMSREVAYGIMVYLNAEKVGAPHRARTEAFVNQALSHLDQWTQARTADYVRPFMFSLTAHALISYDSQIGGDRRILPAIKSAADWIWDNMWLPSQHAFKYTDRATSTGGTEPAPDLNMLIAPAYAWLYYQTGETKYRDRGDQIFAGGAEGAWLNNGKQFNQNYRLSFEFLDWRSRRPKR
jgi:hypothetical protein